MRWKFRLKNYLKNLLTRVDPELHHLKNRVVELERDTRILLDYIDEVSPDILKERDKVLLKEQYHRIFGTPLNFNNPVSFNEKTQWLKIHYRRPGLHKLVDKYRVRDHLKKLGLEKNLIELFGVFADSHELLQSWDDLPNSFVLKVNHWSGAGKFFIHDKNLFNKKRLQELDELLKKNYYHQQRWGEWVYKDIESCIIAEKYLTDRSTGQIYDYKMFCFNGKVKFIQVVVDRFTNHKAVFYNETWDRQEFTQNTPLYEGDIEKPLKLEHMIEISEAIAQEHPFLRVDLYLINQKDVKIGELTFFDGSGFEKFSPHGWDEKLGKLIDLSAITKVIYATPPAF